MWIKITIIMVLGLIFMQDMKARSVYWVMFPLLAVAFLVLRLAAQPLSQVWPAIITNVCFFSLQLLMVWLWFSLRRRRWTSIANVLLGWGDVLFLLAVAFGLSAINFLLFYIISLGAIVLFWTVLLSVKQNRTDKQVPLAGLQAFLLALVLTCDWWWLHLPVTDDAWILNMLQI